MVKPKILSDLPTGFEPYYLIFRKVGEYITCEAYTNTKEVEKVIFDLEHEKTAYRIVKANNLSVEVKVSLTETSPSAPRSGSLGTGLYGNGA